MRGWFTTTWGECAIHLALTYLLTFYPRKAAPQAKEDDGLAYE